MVISFQSAYLHVVSPVLIIFCFTLFEKNSVYASQVYKSVDAEGNISYSYTPPKEAIQTEKMNVPVTAKPVEMTPQKSNIEQMKELADEMEKERIQRKDDRAAVRKKQDEALDKKQAEEEKKQAEKKAAEQQNRYYPVYVPVRPHHPVKPGRPHPSKHRLHPGR